MSSESFQLSCDDVERRQLLQNSSLNGIDYVEVVPTEATGNLPLIVVFLYHSLPQPPGPSPLGNNNFQIGGGTRITNIGVEWAYRFNDLTSSKPKLQAIVTANVTITDPTKVVVVRPTTDGDFSTYTLQIVSAANTSQPPPGFDVLLSTTPFGFKVECPQNFDCNPGTVCPPESREEPVIDYLTKDFNSFNTLMLNRLSLINPAWQERHPADMGVALVELLAYVGDQLSYYQDAVATEAYLGTARRRISVRRHARLLDYLMHDGCNARAWVTMEIDPSVDGLVVPAGTGLLTGEAGDSTVVTGGLQQALQGATVFETMTDATLYRAQNCIQFYTWNEANCCLPLGGTSLTLRNDNQALDVPVFSLTNLSSLTTGAAQSTLIEAMESPSATTTTTAASEAGQNVLAVASATGFAAGSVIMINVAGAGQSSSDEECAVVASAQGSSLVLESNLANAHSAGETVSVLRLATYLLDFYEADWVLGADYSMVGGSAGNTSTSATSTVLRDAQAAWTPDQWAGGYLEYTSGPAAGQSQQIASNTSTTITTAAPFSPAPTVGGGDSFNIAPPQYTITLSDGAQSASVEFGSAPGTATVTLNGGQVDELVADGSGGNLNFFAHTVRIGDVLIFEEVRSPTTGIQADADPSHRCAVRLTGVAATVDPLSSSLPLLNITWAPADAPPFPLCLQTVLDPTMGNQPEPVSVARGNVVLADSGQTQSSANLPLQPVVSGTTTAGVTATVLEDASASWVFNQWVGYHLKYTSGPAQGQSSPISGNTSTTITTAAPFSPAPTAGGGDSFTVSSTQYTDDHGDFYTAYTDYLGNTPGQDGGGATNEDGAPSNFRPGLSQQPVTFAAPFDPTQPASSAFSYDVRTALPEVTVFGQGELWSPKRDLLSSDAFQYQFVTEVDNDGTAYLRFGDGTLGSAPNPSTKQDPNPFYGLYRVGNGTSGNVGRESISRIVNADAYGTYIQTNAPFDGTGITKVRNPMEAQGGTDPEAIEDVRQFAPYAFNSQQRAVTSQDYETILDQYPGVEQGYAQLKWTGSWWTYYVSVDRTAGLAVDAPFQAQIETYLNSYRMAGYDLEITEPVFVALDVEMDVCAAPGYNPGAVQQALLAAFSNTIQPDGTKGFFYPDNFTFGQTVFLSAIYATATSVPGVSSVVVEVFQRYGQVEQGELAAGEIVIMSSEVARLDNDPNFPENGILVVNVGGGEKATGVGSLP